MNARGSCLAAAACCGGSRRLRCCAAARVRAPAPELRLLVHPPEVRLRRLGRRPAHAGQPDHLADRLHHPARGPEGARAGAGRSEDAGRAVLLPGRAQAGRVQPGRAAQLRALRAQRRLRVRRRLQPRHRRPVRQVVRSADGVDLRRRRRCSKLPNNHPLYRSFFQFDGPAGHRLRAQRLGRRPGARLPARASRSTAASACSTATRTTAASGTTTGATSASWPRTTPSSRSTS